MEIELLPCTVLYVLYVNTFLLLVVLIAGPTRPFETRTPDALRAAYGIKDVSTVIGDSKRYPQLYRRIQIAPVIAESGVIPLDASSGFGQEPFLLL
jgi:hypothetical protein